MNTLYYGDCLTIMREKMAPGSVDLVYLDPPFNSKRDYNAIYKDRTGRPLPDQVEAFNDTWFLDSERMRLIKGMPKLLREHGVGGHETDFLASFISGLVHTQSDMAAYLAYMTERLLWIRRVMKPTASIYLHCDPTASHYLKVMMDVIFGKKFFRNHITWKRTSAHSRANRWGSISDNLLFFTKGSQYTWNRIYTDYSKDYIEKNFRHKDNRGRYTTSDLTGAGLIIEGESSEEWGGYNPSINHRHWAVPTKPLSEAYPDLDISKLSVHKKLQLLDDAGYIHWPKRGKVPTYKRYLSSQKGILIQDIITDVATLAPQTNERLGYPTQKPIALLDRIIRASSNEGDVVFDPFCGCATTIEAASKLNRRWVGIDITIHAIRRVARARLQERLHLVEGQDYAIEGVPRDWEGARQLWRQDAYQFQKWCVELVDGFVNVKKSADDGIDGRVYFDMPGEKILQSMALEVKGGENISINSVRALNSILQHENVRMAGLIALNPPGSAQTRNFQRTMALAGQVKIGEREYPKIQMLTVDEILRGAKFDMPSPAGRTETGYERDLFNPPARQ